MIWILLIIFALAAVLSGVAISYVAGAAAVLAFVLTDHAAYLGILPQRIFSQIDVFTFLAMPLFILAGETMTKGGVTRVLIDLAMLLPPQIRWFLPCANGAIALILLPP